MMRYLPLLALLGAAPAPTDITAAATCTLPRAETTAAFKALPLVSSEDDTEADERGTISIFRDATIWGQPARVKLLDYANATNGSAMMSFITTIPADYDTTVARLLALHGKAGCDDTYRGCDLVFANEGKWQHALMISPGGTQGTVALTCIFSIPPPKAS